MPLLSGPLLVFAVAAAAGVGVGILAWALFRAIGRWTGRTEGRLDDSIAKAMAGPMSLLLAVVAAGTALVLFHAGVSDGALLDARRLLTGVFAIGAAWAIVRGIRLALDETGRRKKRFLPATRVGGRLVAVVLYVAAFLTILSEYGISITPVLTGLGIAGLAVALALQDTLANFFSGIWIQTGRSAQPGHYVRLEGDKLEGYVEDVGWRTTRLRLLSGSTIVIPNSKFAQAIMTDFNLPSAELSIGMEFRVAYESEPERVIALLMDEARASMKAMPDKFAAGSEPFAWLAQLDDDCLRIGLSVKVNEYVNQYAVQNDLRMRVLKRLRAEEIRVPYPTRHNYQEPVAGPPAKRKPSAPGGLAPGKRPPRPKREAAPPIDPREAEAQSAKREILAKQQAEGKEVSAAVVLDDEPASAKAAANEPPAGQAATAAPDDAPPKASSAKAAGAVATSEAGTANADSPSSSTGLESAGVKKG